MHKSESKEYTLCTDPRRKSIKTGSSVTLYTLYLRALENRYNVLLDIDSLASRPHAVCQISTISVRCCISFCDATDVSSYGLIPGVWLINDLHRVHVHAPTAHVPFVQTQIDYNRFASAQTVRSEVITSLTTLLK